MHEKEERGIHLAFGIDPPALPDALECCTLRSGCSEAEIATKIHVEIVILAVVVIWIVVMLLVGVSVAHLAWIHRVRPSVVPVFVRHVFQVTPCDITCDLEMKECNALHI